MADPVVTTPSEPEPPRTARPQRPAPVRAALALAITGVEASILAWALGGWAALLAHFRALALIACWAIAGVVLAVRARGRAPKAVARAPESRWLFAGLGLIPLTIPALSAFGERAGAWPLPDGAALRWSGVGLAAAGLAIRLAAMARLGSRFTPILVVQTEHRLETGGLYARIRHPGYLGSLLASLGAALTFGSGVGLVGVLAFAGLIAARVRREEGMLVSHFGDAWREYRSRTGALWPRLGARRRPRS